MSIKDFVLRRAAKHFKVQDSLEFFDAMGNVGTKSVVDYPSDLIPMLLRMLTRGLYTQMAIQPNMDWVLPYWATRQYDPRDPSFIPRMSGSQFNLTHRNWTAVGLPDSDREIVIDPRGLLTPWHEGWSLDTWVELNGQVLYPSREPACEQWHADLLPIVITAFNRAEFRLELEAFVSRISDIESVVLKAKVLNKTGSVLSPRLFISIRPFNPEGGSLVKSIAAAGADTLMVNDSLGVQFSATPDRIYCSNGRDGDCAFFMQSAASRRHSQCPGGLATAYAMFDLRVNPQGDASIIAVSPVRPIKASPKKATHLRAYDYSALRADIKLAWREKSQKGLSLSLPDKSLTDSFRLCKTHLLLGDDGDYITPGPMTYHHYWFRDSAYMITALDRLGLHSEAHQKLLNYPQRQEADGFYLSQPGEWDSAGQAIWTLFEHYRITGDRIFLEKMYASMAKGARWIEKTRRETKGTEATKGLLPPGFSAEHFGPNDFYYWDDFWGVAGLTAVAQAAELLGQRDDWVHFEKEAEDFMADIRASLRYAEARLGKAVMPTGPYRRIDSGAIGTIAALYPLRVMEPFDPLITNTLDALHECCMFENGFFQNMFHSGINAYLTLHIAHCHLFRRESRAWPLIKYVLAKATSAGTWPEAIHPVTGGGCMGDGMHLWAAADWLLALRDLLLFEEGSNLVLTPALPEHWLEWGNRIEVRDAPTHFGPLSFTIEGQEREVVLALDPAWRKAPLQIEWNLPFGVEEARVDGQPANVNDFRLLVPGGTKEVRIKRS